MIAIRAFTEADITAIAGLFEKPVVLFERYWGEQKSGQRELYLATCAGELAGYATLNWRPDYAPFRSSGIPEIQDLNVLARFRRRGIGSALLKEAEATASTRGSCVGIRVGLESGYGAAQRLYVRRGYVPDGHGLVYRERAVRYGETVVADDDLLLCFTKQLR